MPEPKPFQFHSSTVKIPQFHRHHHRRKPPPPPHFASITSLINDSKHHFTQFISSINQFQLNTQKPPILINPNPNLKLSEPSSKPPPVPAPAPFNPNLKKSEVSKPPPQVPSNRNLKSSEVNLKNSEANLKVSEASKPQQVPVLCSASLSLTTADELTQSSTSHDSVTQSSTSDSVASIINSSKQSFTQFVSSINKFQQIIENPPNLLNLKDSEESGELTQSSKSHLITSIVNKFQQIIQQNPKLLNFNSNSNSPVLCSASLSLTEESGELVQSSKSPTQLTSRNDDERVLISEVLVRNKDGEELERKDLEEEAIAALKKCRSNSALTVREVQEDVHRIIGSGYFSSCMPVAVDTRDGIRLVFQVEPNQDFQGLICEGANALPTKFIEDKFRDGYGKIVNVRRLDEVINSINGWYMERGLFGLVSGVEILSGGILRLQVSEAEVNNISVRFLNKTGEPTTGKTRPETILRQLNTKKGQVYSMLQAKRDVDTLLAMGIMEDVSIIPQPAGDSGKVDLTINAVERVSGGISAGGGISSGITSGLAGLIGSCAVYHRNLFGRNQKVNLSLERGQIDSIFRINYTDPWIEGDDKRTSRTIMIQNSRTPGTLVHGPHGTQTNNSSPTITRITGGIEYSRPFRPKWSGTAGLIFQRAGARGERGQPMIKDSLNCPLTASGNNHDDMLLAKVESVYTGSSDPSSSLFVVTMEQGLPVWSEWLAFNRVTARARKGLVFGPARLNLSLSGGHVEGNFPPHEAFPIGGTNSVRGYEEGDIGSGRSYAVGCGEISFPMVGPVEGVMFADYGTDLGSGSTVLGDPAGARSKPGSGYGYGVGVRVASPLGPLRLEYAFSDQGKGRFHFGVGQRN